MFDGDFDQLLKRRMEGEIERRRRENQLARYAPYDRQKQFHREGATHRERLFMAGNQLGKTLAGGMEVAMHLTGRYPEWWDGRRFDKPRVWWVGGVTSEATRDGAQRILLGRAGEYGTGTVPKLCLIGNPVARQGVADAVAVFRARHSSGGASTVIFKSYDQGREKWQADTVDGGVWFDEEPPYDIYSEGLTRTNAVPDALILMTFTPLLGMSEVVQRFMLEVNDSRSVTTMTIDDVDHVSEERKAEIIASYKPHEVEARTKGIPRLGEGAIYPVPEDAISYKPFPFPRHWKRIAGIDFGWDHPTAVAWLAYDPDGDVIYVYDCYRMKQQTPVIHTAAIRAKGEIPLAWPADGLNHEKSGGEPLALQYRKLGAKVLPEPATFDDDAGRSVEAGISRILERMETGRFKVAFHLRDWWDEFRLYQRRATGPLKVPQVYKLKDDLMDATRYAVMMLRFAKAEEAHPTDRYRQQVRGVRPSSSWAA